MRFSRRPRARRGSDHQLIVCVHCGSDYVSPIEWAEHGKADWWMRLRCGECGEVREVLVSQEVANRYDAALNRGTDVIESTLRRLERERMAAMADTFARALELDLVDAADFG